MYFITYAVLSVLLLQQTVSSCIIEFCEPKDRHDVSVNQSVASLDLFIVSPNYPENYNITEGCVVALNFSVNKPFGVSITENVSSCETPLLYQVATFNFDLAVVYSCTLSTAEKFTKVHQIIFQDSSTSDIVLIELNEGSGLEFKLSIASLVNSTSAVSSPNTTVYVVGNSSSPPTMTKIIQSTSPLPVSSLSPNQVSSTSTTTSVPHPGFFFTAVNKVAIGVGVGGLILVVVIIVLVVLLKQQRFRRKPAETFHQNVCLASGPSNDYFEGEYNCSNAGSETTSVANAYEDITLESPHASTADTVQPSLVQFNDRNHQHEPSDRDMEVLYTPIVKKIQLVDNELYDTA